MTCHKISIYYCQLAILLLLGIASNVQGQRKDVLLNTDWLTIASDTNIAKYDTLLNASGLSSIIDHLSSRVSVPHTWDKYEGYRQLKHGNRHGYAWYRKNLTIGKEYTDKQLFLWFEGVSSFATIWVNGKKVGAHAGGRTSFTIDITGSVQLGKVNSIVVKAGHPSFIRTLPWVCGGCSEEQGFSEGSQPMGIFRPVHLVSTASVRIEPFGVHIWNDSNITAKSAVLHTTTELKNYTQQQQVVVVNTRLIDPAGRTVYSFKIQRTLFPNQTNIIPYTTPALTNPRLWSLGDPALYKAVTQVIRNGIVVDESTTSFGIRWVKWTLENTAGNRQILINGKPVFLNGTAEYEHLMGNSHAFTDLEIKARAMQVKAAGFNAFRDAHQPHNLRYHANWDSMGIAWWPQFAAHVWFDLPEFRSNFKSLLRDWIKERRNSPSIILWGLENESTLPEDFAGECCAIIRELDPTASSQRKITTCNGGKGTDWDVPQNWTGTYGGNPADYGSDLIKQVLVGEYGAWRSIDWHTEGLFDQKGALSEDRMTQLMEMKVRLADSVKEQTTGHFHWLLYSHDNPGRVQPDEGYRYIDKVGPVNNKGLFTIWGEPTDAFYMYRSNYTSPATNPMVYIVSHTWPERWLTPGIKSGIIIYSNCDEVELFNDMGQHVSLGRRTKSGTGTHFQWDSVPVQYNVLYAQAYCKGKLVAKDCIVLQHLPEAPHFNDLYKNAADITAPAKDYEYIHRVNCGGPFYKDIKGQEWSADELWRDDSFAASSSWAAAFEGMSPVQASQRRSFDPISNARDWPLFQTYRYGREQLQYHFRVPKGTYRVELYFTEPWYGTGGGMNCKDWRVFDVAINGQTVIKDLDIWKEAGMNKVVKKVFTVKANEKGELIIHFPRIQSSQAVIAAIAIAGLKSSPELYGWGAPAKTTSLPTGWHKQRWLDKGAQQYAGSNTRINYLPSLLYGDSWIQTTPGTQAPEEKATIHLEKAAEVYIALDKTISPLPHWLETYTAVTDSLVNDSKGGTVFRLYKKQVAAGSALTLGNNGQNSEGTAQMYSVIIHEPTAYEKAEKIKRPIITYPAQVASIKGPALDTLVAGYTGQGYATLQNVSDRIVWNITVGVGDTYELRFRYRTAGDKQIPVWLTVRAADGTIMRYDKVFFAPADTKWKTLYSSTGTNINAGNYTVQLVCDSGETLYLDKLEVQ